jgi:hypothetical protein
VFEGAKIRIVFEIERNEETRNEEAEGNAS